VTKYHVLNPLGYGFLHFTKSNNSDLYLKISEKEDEIPLIIINEESNYKIQTYKSISFEYSGSSPVIYANSLIKTYYDGRIDSKLYCNSLLNSFPKNINAFFTEGPKESENDFLISKKFKKLTKTIYIKQMNKYFISVECNPLGASIQILFNIYFVNNEDDINIRVNGREVFNGVIHSNNPEFIFEILKNTGLM
jgi:hypothetical protein